MMDTKILILLLLAVSFLFFGCAKKGKTNVTKELPVIAAKENVSENKTTVNSTNESTTTLPKNETTTANASDKSLADLFQIDTDKPLEDEGFNVSNPSAKK
jgi:uncharacterized lipoprotein YajG